MHRFKVGDLVVRIQDVEAGKFDGSIAGPAMIIERITQECHGGTQFKYAVRPPEGVYVELCDHELAAFASKHSKMIETLNSARDIAVAHCEFDLAAALVKLRKSIENNSDGPRTTETK